MFKRLVVVSSLVAALAGSAFAADMPVKAPRSAVAPTNWTGIWAGAGFGYGMADFNHSVTNAAGAAVFDVGHDNAARGYLGTLAVGADYQFASRFVAGVFADFDWAGAKGQYSFDCPGGCAGPTGYLGETKQNWAVAAGGRLGYLATPQLLTYFTGGWTQAKFGAVNYVDASNNAATGLTLADRRTDGYFVGGGAEYAMGFLPGLFLKTEYRFADYNGQTLAQLCSSAACGGAGTINSVDRSHAYVQTVRSEVVYRYGMSAPMAAASAPLPAANWTGIWAGAGFGYGMADFNHSVTNAAGAAVFDVGHDNAARGYLGTLAVGADYQFASRFVAGVFADFDWAGAKGQYSFDCPGGCAGPTGYLGETKQNWAVAAGGRLGYLATPQLLTYFTGGWTQAKFGAVNYVDASNNAPTGLTLADRRTDGYFVGGGAEYALGFLPGLFLKTEYRFADYNGQTLAQLCSSAACGGAGTINSVDRSHAYVQTVRSEVIYRFNWPGLARL